MRNERNPQNYNLHHEGDLHLVCGCYPGFVVQERLQASFIWFSVFPCCRMVRGITSSYRIEGNEHFVEDFIRKQNNSEIQNANVLRRHCRILL